MKAGRRAFATVLFLALAMLATAPSQASGGLPGFSQDVAEAARVRQFVRLDFRMQVCGGVWAYRITSIAVRWKRLTSSRTIPAAELNVPVRGTNCSNSGDGDRFSRRWKPCFGCGGQSIYETPTYRFRLDRPYILNSGEGTLVGVNARAAIADDDGDVQAHLCSRVTLVNNTDCSSDSDARHRLRSQVIGNAVQQILRVRYDFRKCYDDMYGIQTVTARWHRLRRARDVSIAQVVADGRGGTCGEEHSDRRIEKRFNPCFGCEGARRNWTPVYTFRLRWPALGPDVAIEDLVGVRLVGYAVDSSGHKQKLCTKVQFLKNEYCQG